MQVSQVFMNFALATLGLASGCKGPSGLPDLGGIYNRAASYHGPDRNPIIVIPGILGSNLRDAETGRQVWGAFQGNYANPSTPDGRRLIALPMKEGVPLRELRDGVRSDGALGHLKIELLGLPFEAEAYAHVLKTLGVGGYRDESLGLTGAIDYGDDHYTCFQFDYDWRRDNVENARRLHEFILQKRLYVQKEIEKRYGVKDKDVKFDIIAHSMGGLVARYYLRYGAADLPVDGSLLPITWAGRKHVDRMVLVGTPNAGSAHALTQLVEGIQFASVLPRYSAAILCTFPSIFQLLPRTRHQPVIEASDPSMAIAEDLFDVALWERMKWGLVNPDEDAVLKDLLPESSDPVARRRIARDHLYKSLKRARQFHAALDSLDDSVPGGPVVSLIAGDAVPTTAVLALNRETGKLTEAVTAPGDGTVVRTSALLDERVGGKWSPTLRSPIRWHHVTFLFTDHLGLTRDPGFTDNVLYALLEEPR